MPLKKCSAEKAPESGVHVNVIVNVPKIVRSLCVTAVVIVGIIFGTKTFHKMLDDGFFDNCR